jgi:hypothetical protein
MNAVRVRSLPLVYLIALIVIPQAGRRPSMIWTICGMKLSRR